MIKFNGSPPTALIYRKYSWNWRHWLSLCVVSTYVPSYHIIIITWLKNGVIGFMTRTKIFPCNLHRIDGKKWKQFTFLIIYLLDIKCDFHFLAFLFTGNLMKIEPQLSTNLYFVLSTNLYFVYIISSDSYSFPWPICL